MDSQAYSSPSPWYAIHPACLEISVAVVALSSIVHVTNKGVREHGTQHQAQRNITCQLSPHGHLAIDSSSLRVTIHPIPTHRVLHLPNMCLFSLETRMLY